MKWWFFNYFSEQGFRREFRHELKTLVLVTLGFTIAFSWRQTIFDLSLEFMGWLTNITSPGTLSVLASALITFFSLGLIYVSSHFLKDGY